MMWMINRSCNQISLSLIRCRNKQRHATVLKWAVNDTLIRSMHEVTGDVLPPGVLMGIQHLRDGRLNKGQAFTIQERQTLGIHGMLPPKYRTQDEQMKVTLRSFRNQKDDISKFAFLSALRDRHEKLFFRLITEHITEMMPIIYTPTVGTACLRYSEDYKQPRGMFITIKDKGHCIDIINNWPESDIRAICVTDGERILGLGDLGANGMPIAIGKLTLYTALGGVRPHTCLPITIDVGTNNKQLLKDDYYLGLAQPRVTGPEYFELMDEFMEAVVTRYGLETLIQFEDFGNKNAFILLKKYKHKFCTFNDDIQGTASVVLGGLYTTNRLTGKRMSENTMLFLGAGEAGLGIAELCCKAMQSEGQAIGESRKNIWMFDVDGLLVNSRKDLDDTRRHYAKDHKPTKDFLGVVKEIKPSILVGVSAVSGGFTPEILQAMASFNERPVVFALSNPTSKAECTPQQAYDNTEGRVIFASGSPFPPVHYNGKTYHTGQGNNAYIFPGIGLGVILAGIKHIRDEVFILAAKCLADRVEASTIERGAVYPPLSQCRDVSIDIAAKVMSYAYKEGIASMYPEPKSKSNYVRSKLYNYQYTSSTPTTWKWY